MAGWLVWLAVCLVLLPVTAWSHLNEDLARSLAPPGYDLGPLDPNSFAFPLIKAGRIEGYIFDTLDYAPVPGFSGTPMEIVVAIDPRGTIMDVHLLNQNEPVFVDGLGVEPFLEFLKQYQGKQIRQNISVGSIYGSHDNASQDGAVVLDGIVKASASVRIANVTILSSAVAVARTHFAGAAPPTGAKVKTDYRETLDWAGLVKQGYVQTLMLDNKTVQKAFADSVAAHDDPDGEADPDGLFTRIDFAMADIPSVGIALFGEAGYAKLMKHLDKDDHALAIFTDGRWSLMGGNFVRGTQPQRIKIEQSGFAIGGRDLPFSLDVAPSVPVTDFMILRLPGSAGLDPSAPWSLSAVVSREHGILKPDVVSHSFAQSISMPGKFFTKPDKQSDTTWIAAWTEQWQQISFLLFLLTGLTVGLICQKRLTLHKKRFDLFRLVFLAITLVWIGWIEQAQLSIVTVLGLVKAVFFGADMGFLLFDPPSLILWIFTLVCLVVWGRGSFCGWLCPFGALQEFADKIARLAKIPKGKVSPKFARFGIWIKYAVLLFLVAGTVWNSALAEILAEVEPFKTSITLGFHRDPAFVAYAVGLLVWGMFVYKPFCRFLCPLGASLALVGRTRRWNWIPRRAECGTPCKLCEKSCAYGAIAPKGTIDYAECFQCLDCVAIYHDRKTCVPLVLEDRRGRKLS
jgi:transcriptional regulator of nitric oxide reductase